MAHIRQELALDTGALLRRLLGLFLFALLFFSLAHIVYKGREQAIFSQLKRRDGRLGGELVAVAVTRCQLEPLL